MAAFVSLLAELKNAHDEAHSLSERHTCDKNESFLRLVADSVNPNSMVGIMSLVVLFKNYIHSAKTDSFDDSCRECLKYNFEMLRSSIKDPNDIQNELIMNAYSLLNNFPDRLESMVAAVRVMQAAKDIKKLI